MPPQDFVCSECQKEFRAAAALLQHFALHAASSLKASKKLPDLIPIPRKSQDWDVESDSGVEDVNPMKFCLVTMAGDEKIKKYECKFCSKRFGWSTDLKRHVLIHTGERPFACTVCGSTFTRNFLLKKHQRKCHEAAEKPGNKSRKQEKSKIKRFATDGVS